MNQNGLKVYRARLETANNFRKCLSNRVVLTSSLSTVSIWLILFPICATRVLRRYLAGFTPWQTFERAWVIPSVTNLFTPRNDCYSVPEEFLQRGSSRRNQITYANTYFVHCVPICSVLTEIR